MEVITLSAGWRGPLLWVGALKCCLGGRGKACMANKGPNKFRGAEERAAQPGESIPILLLLYN